MKHKNTFSKGLNQDNTRSKYNQANYYDALNIRVTTHDGLSTGSIENENGNSLTFEIPDLVAENNVIFTDGSTTSHFKQINPKIIGWTTMDRHVIVFTTTDSEDTSTVPSTIISEGMGQIWRFEYDETTNSVDANFLIGATKQLNPDTALRYNGRLNYSVDHRIEAVGRYENDKVGRVYYTDNFNTVRTFNVLDDDLRVLTGALPNGFVNTIGPGETDIKTDVTHTIPKPISVGTGSLQVGGKVGMAYRLVDSEGAVTLYSPASALVNLTDVDESIVGWEDIEGLPSNGPKSKSVTFQISGVDTSFERIEYIALYYSVLGSLNIYQFGEENVPADGNVTVILNGNEAQIPIDQVEFSALSVGFEKCKSLDVKDNRLVIGNIRTAEVEIPDDLYEARAYRFRDDGAIRLTNLNSSYTQFNSNATDPSAGDWSAFTHPNFPIDHDAINPYNYKTDPLPLGYAEDPNIDQFWGFSNQYKYQTDLTTVGGEGPNIKYEFVNTELTGDSQTIDDSEVSIFQGNYIAPFTKINKFSSTDSVENGELNPDGTPSKVSLTNEYKSFHSPIVEAHLTGYTRGEIYRFGIQFITKKGTPTFVKWIGDIRFPEPGDGFPVGTSPSATMGISTVKLNTLGIKFTVNITQALLDYGISGYRIVRAERRESDRTKLGTGTFFCIDRALSDDSNGDIDQYLYEALYNIKENPGNPEEVECEDIELNGVKVSTGIRHVADSPFFNLTANLGWQQNNPETKGALTYFSPLTFFKQDSDFQFKTGDYLKILGYYNTSCQVYTSPNNGGTNQDYEFPGFVHKARYYRSIDNLIASGAYPDYTGSKGTYTYLIDLVSYLEDGEILENLDPKMPESIYGGKFINASYATNTADEVPLAIGVDTCLMSLDRINNGNHELPSNMNWYNPQLWKFGGNSIFLSSNNPDPNNPGQNIELRYDGYWMKEVSYTRPLLKQYTGVTHEDRSKQKYISTNHYQPITTSNQAALASHTFNVYGGDTYVSYFDKEILVPYQDTAVQNPTGAYANPHPDKRMSVAFIMPMESYMNLDLMYGDHFNRTREGNNFGLAIDTESRRENDVYRQQNDSEGKSFAKDFALDFTNVFPHRLWASEIKFDGDIEDKWRDFSANSYIDVEGTYGPINKVINYQDQLYFYQDRAFGIGSINERDMINSATTGAQITVGTGTVLEDFRYITTTSGTVHQFSVIRSATLMYHYDALNRKLYKTSGRGLEPVSDIKGLSNFFAENVVNAIRSSIDSIGDTTVKYPNPIGVVSGYDSRHNRVFFTFLDAGNPDLPYFTISYNEASQALESFYSFTPSLYMHLDGRMMTVDRSLPSKSYVHDEGPKGIFYDATTPAESYITLLIAPNADIPKVFNNLEYNSEVFLRDINGDYTDQQTNETITSLEYYNDYQESGVIPVVVPANVKRRMRHWRHTIIRDQSPNSPNQRARFRDYHIFLKLSFDNANDKRLVLHDIITSYMPARD